MTEASITAAELRQSFVDYFVERDHTPVPSASLIPHDATVLFTVAGMVPFAAYLTGEEPAPYPRAVSVQKCVRAGGKHNDLDEIGRTSRHLTFFEMMGNFSFGDYFKSEAIPYAWDFVTKRLGLDPERLWVTVHTSDDEAEQIWLDTTPVPAERIQRLDEDNFWQMADTGPCGPCSEIFWDKGPEYGPEGGPADGGEERYVEIWNLVFMQFERQDDGTQVPLPRPSIDTGAGLERILSVLQGVDSVFDTDEFVRLIGLASKLSGVEYGADERSDISLRILSEHARTMTVLVSDGVVPSNEDRGYVLRRIIRRAVRHAYLLGIDELVMPPLVDEVVAIMGDDYPDLVTNHSLIADVVRREEEGFRETLRTGSAILDTQLDQLANGAVLDGSVAFRLHDTYGFPLEVTQEIAAEQGIEVDVDGFDVAMAEQRDRAKAAHRAQAGPGYVEAYRAVRDEHGATGFVGRDDDEVEAEVLAVFADGQGPDGDMDDDTGDGGDGAWISVVLDRTPFYAESGGQIGDTGVIEGPNGTVTVVDTTYGVPGLHRHHGRR